MDESGGMTSKDYWGVGLAGASVLPALFGGGGSSDDPIKELLRQSQQTGDFAKSIQGQSSELLGPAMDYLKAVLSGDQQALLHATMPERKRVIDQYATAKKAIAEFTPRGGGQASSLNKLESQQAGDLAQVGSQARAKAFDTAGTMGTQLAGTAVSASNASAEQLNAAIRALQQNDEASGNRAAGIGQALGTIAAMIFL